MLILVFTNVLNSQCHFYSKIFFNLQNCLFSMSPSNLVFSNSASTCLGKILEARSQITWDLAGFITYNKATEASALFPAKTFITLGTFMYFFCNFHLSSKYDGSSLVCCSDGRGKQQLASQAEPAKEQNKYKMAANSQPRASIQVRLPASQLHSSFSIIMIIHHYHYHSMHLMIF